MEYNKERVSQLYNAVIDAGFKPSELGKDANEFAQKMIDKPERISSLYNAAIDAGFKASELGKNAAEFGNNMGIPLTEPTKEEHVNSTNTQVAPQNEEKSFFDKAKDFLTPDDQTLESLKGIGKEVAKAAVPILAPAAAPMVGAINAVNELRNHAKQEEDAKPVQNTSAENPTKQYLNRFDDFNKSVSTLKDDGVWSDAAVAKDLAKKAQYRIQEALDSKTDGAFGQFVGSFWKNNDVSGVWTAGVSDARNAVAIYNAVKQYNDNPSKVTPEQEAIVKALYFANEADNIFGERTMWQQAGSGAMQTAEFGTEFLASAGIGSIAKKIGMKLGIKLSTEALEAMTKKAIQKAVFGNEAATKIGMTLAKGAAEATVKGAAQTALTGYGHVKAGAYENMVGQTNSGYDENGHFQFNGNTPINKDPYDAWMHSLISQNIENTTEYVGETLSYAVKGAIKQAGKVLNKIPKIKLTRGVGDAVNTVAGKVEDAITPTEAKQLAFGGFLKKMVTLGEKPVTSTAEELQKKYGSMAYLGLEAKKYVNSLVNSPIYKTAGIHSLPEEWLEEQAGTILNAAFTGDSKISDLADGGQQLQTLVSLVTGCGLMGGIHKAVGPHGQGNFESENSLMAAQRLRDVITSDPKLAGNNPDQILGDIESYVSKYGIENQAKFINEMNTSLGLDKSGSRALTQYALSLDLLYAKNASQKYEDMENAFKHNKRIANSTDEQGNVKMAKLNGADVVVKSLSDDHATVEDYEGTKSMIPVSSLQGLTNIPAKQALIDTEDLKLSKLDISKEELVHQVTPDEAKQNKFNPGDVLSVNIGGVHTPATVDEMTADGNVVVNFATPVSANGKEEKMTWSFSPEEISNIIQTDPIAHTDGEQGVPEESPEYPTTKDGLVDYKAITNPNELVMAIGETEGEKSLSAIDAMLQEATKSLTETEALPAEEKTQRQNQINNWIERLQRARVSFDTSPTTEEDESDAQSVTQPTAEQEKAPVQFPRDKDGNIDYKQIDEPQMYASALQEEFGKDANTIVDEELNSLNKQLEATAKKGSAVQKARARKNLSAQIEKMNSVKQFIVGKEETKEEQPPVSNEAKASDNKQEVQTPSIPVNEAGEKLYHEVPVKQTLADINDGSLTPDEAKAFIEANKKAAESSLEKLQKKAPKIGTNKEDYLAQKQKHLQAIEGLQRIADYWQSVKQEAERGHEEERRAKAIKEDELNRPRNISELASQMLGGDIKLLWNDSGNGVIKKKGVKSHTGYSDSEKKNILGILSSSENGGMSIEEAGERVEEHAKELGIPYDETDATAGMDALLNVLSSSRTWGDIKNYVHKTREDEARKQAEAEEAEYEDWVERKYHMSSKEYDAWNDTFDSRAESYFKEEEKAESEIFPIFAELENKENERRREAEKVPLAERSANGNDSTTVQEVLQGSPTRGDFKQSEESGSSDRNLERQGEAERSLQDGSSLGGNEQTGSSRIEQATSSGALDVAKAETEVDPNPTEAQKEAGNYKKGHVKLAGYDITIENPVNSIRRGVDENGKPWEVKMNNTYGYFRGTKGKDGDHIDTFLSSGGNYDGPVYVIDQIKPDGSFDESKVMLGFNSEEEAKKAYLSNYSSGWKGLGNITGVSKEAFDDWMSNRKQQRKPFAEYVNIALDSSSFDTSKYEGSTIYHGSPDGPIESVDPYVHSKNWRNGLGFYTTESKDVAEKYSNGRTASKDRKSKNGAVTKLSFPSNVKLLDMDAPSNFAIWDKIAKEEGLNIIDRSSKTNKDAYVDIVESYNEENAASEGQYAIEEKLSALGFDGSTHIEFEGKDKIPNRVFIWKNEDKLPSVIKNNDVPILSEDEYLNLNGANFMNGAEFALHKGKYDKSKAKNIDLSLKKMEENNLIRDNLRKEYAEKVKSGEIKNPTQIEKLIRSANGNIDNESTKAAIRSLEKRGIDWKKEDIRFRMPENYVENEQSIIDTSKKNGTFMKAPNGADTNLNKKQWVQVRTKAFKKWFGDWEKVDRIEKLRKSKPIEITGEEYKGKYELNRESAKEYIKDKLRGEYTIDDTGESVSLTKVGAKKVTSHSMGNESHLKSIAVIPELIKNAIFIEEQPNTKDNNKYDSYRYYVLGLKIGDEDYTVKLTIGVKQGHKYYDHALTQIEKGKLLDLSRETNPAKGQAVKSGFTTTGDAPEPSYTVGKDTKLISILQTNSSKVVDENGEPMVVYHGTGAEFTIFKPSEDGALGRGMYFSESREFADSHSRVVGGKSISVFLSIRNPYETESPSVDTDKITKEGHDGVFAIGPRFWVAFEPHQIKSATDNTGEFSSENEDIRYRERKSKEAEEINTQFNTELENLTEENSNSTILHLGNPSTPLISAGIPNKPFLLYGNKLIKKAKKHGFNIQDVKDLPIALSNPIAVFEGGHPNSYAILTEMNINGNNVLVSVETEKTGEIDFNLISSVFGKEGKGIINWINKGKLRYSNKNQALNYLRTPALIAGATDNQELDSAANIVENFENPSIESVKLSQSSIKRHKPITQEVISKNAQPVKQKEVIDAAKESAQKLGVEVRIVSSDEIVGKNESDKRQSKGWYDPLTGRVYLVADNAENAADAIATVMHEAVGHKGLRSLLGIRFHAFLGSVYTALPHEIQLQMQTDGIPDTEKIEELLAGYAEDEKYHKDLTTWQEIRGAFNYHMSKIMGRPFRMNDTNLRYLFYRAAESKNAGNELKAVASLKDESVRKRLFGKSEKVKTALLDTYSKRTAQPLNKLFTIVVDKLHPVKILQQELEKQTGKGIEDFENVYQAEMLRSSKTRGIADNIERIYYKPFINAVSQMVDCGLTPEEVNHYMMAKHMPERNDHMREEKMSEGNLNVEGKDFAGASALMKKIAEETQKPDFNKDDFLSKKGFSEEQYNDLMSHYESGDFDSFCRQYANIVEEQIAEQDPNLIEKLWETTNALNQTSVRLEYRSGILSKEKYDEIISMYNNYVPLRGWDQTMAEDLHKYTTSATSLFNDPLKGANGRASLPDDVIATMSNVITSAIEISEKNRVGKALLYLSQNHPGKLLRTASVWYVENELGEWEEKYPTITPGMEETEINEAFRTFNETMEALEAEGKAKKQLSKVDLQVPFEQRRHAQEHVVYAYVNGVKHSVFVNGDPIVAQLINGTAQKNVERITWKATKVLSRWLASSYTTRNPNFILSNFSRDNIFALTAIIAKEDLNYLNSYRRNYKNSVLTLRKYFAGKVDKSSPEFEALNRFLENGGETGFSINTSVEDWKNKYQKMIDEINGKELTVTKAASAVSKFTNDYNRIAELVSRFNTYQTSISQGRSVSRAVMDAKEVTVNFNRTGLGGEGFFGQTFAIVRGSYVFFNAGIQGLYNISKLYKSHPIKMTGVTLATFTMGSAVIPMLNSLMLSLFGDDDDKKYYDNLPDYMANNNLVLFTPVGGFITIPLPIELRSIYGMGRIINEYAKGNRKQLNLGADLVKQFSAILPVDPMEGGRAWWLPSVIRPLGEAYIYNENFYGGRISNDSYYNENDPEYTKAPKGTGGLFKFLSEWSNSLGNDDKLNATKNSIGLLDWNPAKMEHVFEGYFGGSFKVVSQISNTVINGINAAKGEEEFTTRNVPLLNVLFRTQDETIINRAVNEKFYEYKGQVESREKNAAIYKSIYKSSDAKIDNTQKETAVKEYTQMMRSSQSQYDHTFNFYNDMISKLYKSIDSVTDKKQKELLQNRINDLKENAVIEYEKNIPLLWEDHEKEE